MAQIPTPGPLDKAISQKLSAKNKSENQRQLKARTKGKVKSDISPPARRPLSPALSPEGKREHGQVSRKSRFFRWSDRGYGGFFRVDPFRADVLAHVRESQATELHSCL